MEAAVVVLESYISTTTTTTNDSKNTITVKRVYDLDIADLNDSCGIVCVWKWTMPLPSVVAGLITCPVNIAVPTLIGYLVLATLV